MSGILQRLLQGGKSGALVLFDQIVAKPNAKALRYGDNEQLTKAVYPLGYAEVLKRKNNAEQGNIFSLSKTINNANDGVIIGGKEYVICTDHKLKVWKKPDESTPAEWVTLATYNRIGTKIIVNGTKIIFLYSDSDFGPDINTGIAVCNTLDDSCVKIPLWVTDGSIWHTSRESLHLVGEYISFRNNTAVVVTDLTTSIPVSAQAQVFWQSKYYRTDDMNLFSADTIDGTFTSISGIDRPGQLLVINADELLIHVTVDGGHKNYIYNGTTFTEKAVQEITLVSYKKGFVFGFNGTTILSSSDKGSTWGIADLSNTINSIGINVDSDDIIGIPSDGIYSRVFGLIQFKDTITLTDTSTVEITYYKHVNGETITKICLPTEQTKLDSIFTDKGILDYFVLAETSEYFKIPRANLSETFSGIGLQKCWYIN